MSFEADVCWVKPNNVLQSVFGYMIDGVRYAPITRETYLEVQYNNWYNTTYLIDKRVFRCKHKAVVTPTGATIETYSPDGETLLNTSSVTYSESVTFTKAIGLLGRKNTVSGITDGSFRGGLGRLKCYGDDHFGTLVADFCPCYYNNNFGFWETEGEAMHIGTTPSDILGFGAYWDTDGFYPNAINDRTHSTAPYLVDDRDYISTREFPVTAGQQVQFNVSPTTLSTTTAALMCLNSNYTYVDWYTYNAVDRIITLPSNTAYVRLSIPKANFGTAYLKDYTNNTYIWKGQNVI